MYINCTNAPYTYPYTVLLPSSQYSYPWLLFFLLVNITTNTMMTATTIKPIPITKSTAPPPITPFAALCLTAPAPLTTLTVHDGWTVTKAVVVATRLHDGWTVILGVLVAQLHDGWSVPVLVTTAACNIFIVTSLVLLVHVIYFIHSYVPSSATQPTSCICQQNNAVD